MTGIQHDFVSLAHSRQGWGIGASVDRLGTSDIIEADEVGRVSSTEGSYSELRASLALSAKTGEVASIGVTGNYFRIGSINASDDASIDIGVLSRGFTLFSRPQAETQLRLRLGIALRDLYHSRDEISPQYTAAGTLQLRSRQGLLSIIGSPLIALAYASRIEPNRTSKLAVGVEFGPDAANLGLVKGVKLHLGMEHYPGESDNFNWKAGVRIGGGGWWLHYAHEEADFLGGSDRATIDFGFDTKLIQNVTVRKILDEREIKGEPKFETTDEIAMTIHLLDDIALTEVESSAIQLSLTDATGTEISRVNYGEMDRADAYAPRYVFQPVRDGLEKLGALQPGAYTAHVSVHGQVRWKEHFELDYDSEVKEMVEDAQRQFDAGQLGDAQAQLLEAVERDPSYPDTYYVAGLVSELSDDFRGAQKCYKEASKLNPEAFKDLQEVSPFPYLQMLTELQESQNRPEAEVGLYEQLKQTSFGMRRSR